MRFPARPAALLAALIALTASALTATTAVPAQADDSAVVKLPKASPTGDVYGDEPGDATMYMRRLAVTHGQLRGAARKQADASLSRPTLTGDRPLCSTTVPICVHYASGGTDAPPSYAWVGTVLDTLQKVYRLYQRAGYKMPESDGTMGGDSKTDIYLANIGQQRYYGYCAPEQRAGSRAHHMPAFCVLDNDFAEFPNQTPEHNLDVTVAHEFFHAVQFAYDATEDPWFMEGTAAWMESYAYPSISDNTQYLGFSPLRKPRLSMDKNTDFGVYGAWIFFRWVTEHRPAAQGGLPTIVRSMWERAAAKGKDQYSLQAVASAMKAAGLPLRTAFARFAADNRNPRHTYSKGAANHYPVARPTASYKLRTVTKRSGTVRINHLAAATERFVPKGHRLKRKHTKLRLQLDMANKSRGTGAVVTVYLRGGGTRVKNVKLSASGKGALTVPFSTKKVRRVELTMTNASTRMTCWVGGLFSCEGQPKDMGQLERFTAQVRR